MSNYNTRPAITSSYGTRDRIGIYYLLDVWDWTYLKVNTTEFLYLQDPLYDSQYTVRPIIS